MRGCGQRRHPPSWRCRVGRWTWFGLLLLLTPSLPAAVVNLGLDGIIHALQPLGSAGLVAGGSLAPLPGTPAPGSFACWDGTTWTIPGGGLHGPTVEDGLTGEVDADGIVAALAVDQASGRIYAGGFLTTAGTGASVILLSNLACWDGHAWSDCGGGTDGPVLALMADGVGGIFVAGSFATAGGIPAPMLAHWDGQHWSAPTVPPTGTGMGVIRAISPPSVAGTSISVAVGGWDGHQGCAAIAMWDPTTNQWNIDQTTLAGGVTTLQEIFAIAPSSPDQWYFAGLGGVGRYPASPGDPPEPTPLEGVDPFAGEDASWTVPVIWAALQGESDADAVWLGGDLTQAVQPTGATLPVENLVQWQDQYTTPAEVGSFVYSLTRLGSTVVAGGVFGVAEVIPEHAPPASPTTSTSTSVTDPGAPASAPATAGSPGTAAASSGTHPCGIGGGIGLLVLALLGRERRRRSR